MKALGQQTCFFISGFGQAGCSFRSRVSLPSSTFESQRLGFPLSRRHTGETVMLARATSRSRKPHGYWKEWSHLEEELLDYVSDPCRVKQLGRCMPSQIELHKNAHGDLLQAIRRHGGFLAVAKRLNLPSRRARKESGFYSDLETLKRQLIEFMAQDAHENQSALTNNTMPTQQRLRIMGRSDLAEAITLHGGMTQVASALGMNPRRLPKKYWTQFHNLATEIYSLVDDSSELDQLVMPQHPQLRKLGRADIAVAIQKHGGTAEVSWRLGLEYNLRTASNLKKWSVFSKEMEDFVSSNCVPGKFPTQRQLDNYGRTDLIQGILHYGGPEEVADRLGLDPVPIDWGFANVAKRVLDFAAVHGQPDVMPLEEHFVTLRRKDLHLACEKFGYRQTANRLGLEYRNDVTQRALDRVIMSSGLNPNWKPPYLAVD